MNDVCTQEDELNFMYWQAEIDDWKQQQREKAPEILALLRKHLPADRIQEVEEFLSNLYGCKCLHEALRPDLTIEEPRWRLPRYNDDEIPFWEPE